jgi:hypothetical protein
MGMGFVTFHPCLSRDGVTAFYTGAEYARNTVHLLDADDDRTVGVNVASLSNCPYSNSDLTTYSGDENSQKLRGRIVSYGYRITYTGQTTTEGGVSYLYTSPEHQNALAIAQNASYSSSAAALLGANAETVVCGTTREPCMGSIAPNSPDEASFYVAHNTGTNNQMIYPFAHGSHDLDPENSDFAYSAGDHNVGAPTAVAVLTGTAGNTYLVEIIQHSEYCGELVQANSKPTEIDQDGFNVVTRAVTKLATAKQSEPDRPILSLFGDLLKEGLQVLKPIAIDAVFKTGKMALTSLLL